MTLWTNHELTDVRLQVASAEAMRKRSGDGHLLRVKFAVCGQTVHVYDIFTSYDVAVSHLGHLLAAMDLADPPDPYLLCTDAGVKELAEYLNSVARLHRPVLADLRFQEYEGLGRIKVRDYHRELRPLRHGETT